MEGKHFCAKVKSVSGCNIYYLIVHLYRVYRVCRLYRVYWILSIIYRLKYNRSYHLEDEYKKNKSVTSYLTVPIKQ